MIRLINLGSLLMFSRSRKCLRRGILFMLSNGLLIAGCLFAAEVIVIVLGVQNIHVPINRVNLEFLNRFF